jgi:hypothetical protein
MKKIFQFLVIIILTTSCSISEKTDKELNIITDYNVNLFHFVDHLSQWSEYTGNEALKLYEKYFELNSTDNEMLKRYATVRDKLCWEEEINLFNWANGGFKINQETASEYSELKIVLDYFANRKNDKYSVEGILKTEYSKLIEIEPQIKEYSSEIEKIFSEIEPWLKIWTPEPDYSKYPIYICFSHSDNSTHGGANGNGVYSEFMVNDKQDGVRIGFSIITHELTHKVTDIMNFLMDFIRNDNSCTEKAQRFLNINDLTKNELIKIFESVDTLGFGNPEVKVFEEINVYFIAPVFIEKMNEEQIKNKVEKYRARGNREFERVWYGVSLFKKEYENFNNQKINRDDFVWKLIEIFYENIYFENYKS